MGRKPRCRVPPLPLCPSRTKMRLDNRTGIPSMAEPITLEIFTDYV